MGYIQKKKYSNILCFGAFGNTRLDHMFANVNNCEKYQKDNINSHIILIGINSMMIYLHGSNKYLIKTDSPFIERDGSAIITFSKVNRI